MGIAAHVCRGEGEKLIRSGLEQAPMGAMLAEEGDPVNASSKLKISVEISAAPKALTVGFSCMLHLRGSVVECDIFRILSATDVATGIMTDKPNNMKVGDTAIVILQLKNVVAA